MLLKEVGYHSNQVVVVVVVVVVEVAVVIVVLAEVVLVIMVDEVVTEIEEIFRKILLYLFFISTLPKSDKVRKGAGSLKQIAIRNLRG